MSWEDALRRPGAEQMRHLRAFMEQTPLQNLVPDQSLLLGGLGENADHKRAIRSGDKTFVAVYQPKGASFSLKPSVVGNKNVRWYDPRTGHRLPAKGQAVDNAMVFQPPSELDWVLEMRSPEAK